jgi:hypothetical protein
LQDGKVALKVFEPAHNVEPSREVAASGRPREARGLGDEVVEAEPQGVPQQLRLARGQRGLCESEKVCGAPLL